MKNALLGLLFAFVTSSLASAQCACAASTTGTAPNHLAANWFVSGTFTNLPDIDGTCLILPVCPGPAAPCKHNWVMDFTVTITAGNGPTVAACLSMDLGLPICFGIPYTAYVPPSSFQFTHALIVDVNCGHNLGGQYAFTEGAVSILSGFVFMLCDNC